MHIHIHIYICFDFLKVYLYQGVNQAKLLPTTHFTYHCINTTLCHHLYYCIVAYSIYNNIV